MPEEYKYVIFLDVYKRQIVNGLDAVFGSGFVERAFMFAKLFTANFVIHASVPPANITSAFPILIVSKASPI